MPDNLAQQNSVDVSQFDATIQQSYDAARKQEALDFSRQFTDTPAAAPAEAAVAPAAEGEGTPAGGRTVAQDVTLGVMQSPRHVSRGVVKGINGIMDFIDGAASYVPTVSLLDDQGDFSAPEIVTSGTGDKRRETRVNKDRKAKGLAPIDMTGAPEIPVPDKPKSETVTGSLIEGISQFAVGLKGVDKLGKLGKVADEGGQIAASAVKKIAEVIGKGSLADLLAFDEHEKRLSNIVQQVPDLQNPVTEYLQAKPDDTFAEGKLKQAIEGVVTNAAGEALFGGIKLLKKGMGAKAELEAGGGTIDDILDLPNEERAGTDLQARHFEFLGNPDAEPVIKRTKLEASADEVEGAFSKTKRVEDNPQPRETIDDYEINFARIQGPDDIKSLMDFMVNKPELKESIEAARRGKQSNQQTLSAAQDIDGFESLMARRTGDAFNAENIVAARKVYYDSTSKLMDAAKRAASPEASDIDQFNFRKMVAIHHAVQKDFMGIRAEAGRALQAWNIPVGGSGAQNARDLTQILNEFGGADASKALATRLAAVGDKLNTDQINAIVGKGAFARTVDAVSEAWTLGLLTNPTTHVVNLTSNVMTGWQLGLERLMASQTKGSPVTLREGAEFFIGLLESQKLGFKNMAQAFRTGETGFGLGKIDLPRVRASSRDILDPEGKAGFLSKGLDGWGSILEKYVGRSLAAGDEYGKTVLYQAQVRALAVREGISRGLEGPALAKHVAERLTEPSASIRADAVTFANYGTFTKQLGETGQAVQRVIARNPALRFIAPFVRTPANIFKFTFERTPLAVMSQKVRDDISAGGIRRATAMSRIAMGSTVMAMGSDLALQGKVTGSGPTDPKVKAALKRTGWQPYSIKIGDTWYSYARFEPVATPLGIAADMAEIISNYEAYDIDAQDSTDQLAIAAAMAVANQVVGKTFMRGFADLTEALSDPKRYGEQFLQKFAGSFVPAGSAAVERAIDPTTEQVFSMADSIKSRIPGMSESVPPRRNVWGEPIKTFYPNDDNLAESTAERVLSLFNPVYSSQEKDGAEVDRWMLRNGFTVDMPDKTQDFEGVKISLKDYPQAYDRLVELRGNGLKLQKYGNQGMKDFLTKLAEEKDPFGRHLGFFLAVGNSYDDQQNFISQVVRDYTRAAKEQVLDEHPEIGDQMLKFRKDSEIIKRVRQSIPQQEGAAQ